MIEQLQAQLGGMFWVVAIGAPVLVLVMVLQVVLLARSKGKQLKQTARIGSVVTDRSAPTTGPVAFGLACGAHLAVSQGIAWNDLDGAGLAKVELRENLAELWGVRTDAEWRQAAEAKLAVGTDNLEHVAVDLRRQAAAADYGDWRRAIDRAARTGQVPAHSVSALVAAVDRISAYEDRLRADGMITGVVPSVRVYDWGRAVNLARWGLRAGYCDRAAAEQVVLRAGELCAAHYESWADLSAGFALGRLLFFDDEDFPEHYDAVAEVHRRLLSDDGSPYLTLPYPTRRSPSSFSDGRFG